MLHVIVDFLIILQQLANDYLYYIKSIRNNKNSNRYQVKEYYLKMGCVNSNAHTKAPSLIKSSQNQTNPTTIINPLHQPYSYINSAIPPYSQPIYNDGRISQNLSNFPQQSPYASSMMVRSTVMNINPNFYANGQSLKESSTWALRESQQNFSNGYNQQPIDLVKYQKKKKILAQFAMHNRIEIIMEIYHKSLPFQLVKELQLSKFIQLLQVIGIQSLGNCCLNQICSFQIFPQLQILNLSNNNIKLITNLQFNVQLISLNLSYNKIQIIQNLSKLIKLQQLYLNDNQIKKIQHLFNLTNLRQLCLGHNRIRKIQRLTKLVNLEILGLQLNFIQKIQALQQLKNLKLLMLGGNQIQKIQNIQQLTSLQILSLQDNMIEKIENIYLQSRTLKEIKLQYNYIQKLQTEFIIKQIFFNGAHVILGEQKQKTMLQKIVHKLRP